MEELVTQLLASVAGGRRYWVRAPQRMSDGSPLPKPYVVLQRIDGLPDYHMKGPSGYVSSRVQADVYGDTYASTKLTARSLKSVLSGHRDENIQGIFIESERDLPAADAGDVTNLFRTSVDFIIHHTDV